ncbi:MAG TPA: cytochrome c biogenesis protein ResB, partial [Bacteroidales bacterium]|nr:cytochrome c biogenesis protein ResB [Bacteroidales bacterium]
IIHEDGSGLVLIEDSLRTQLAGWKIGVVDYLPLAWPENKSFIQKDTVGATPAALVVAINPVSKDTVAGWIASGSFRLEPKYLALGSDKLLFLTKPEPRKFSSEIVIRSKDNQTDTVRIFVNKPVTKAGWKFYQMSYDTQRGKWSNLSVIEAVRDPWLPVVYVGIFLMLAGAVYIFWIGREGNEEPTKKSQGEV